MSNAFYSLFIDLNQKGCKIFAFYCISICLAQPCVAILLLLHAYNNWSRQRTLKNWLIRHNFSIIPNKIRSLVYIATTENFIFFCISSLELRTRHSDHVEIFLSISIAQVKNWITTKHKKIQKNIKMSKCVSIN